MGCKRLTQKHNGSKWGSGRYFDADYAGALERTFKLQYFLHWRTRWRPDLALEIAKAAGAAFLEFFMGEARPPPHFFFFFFFFGPPSLRLANADLHLPT